MKLFTFLLTTLLFFSGATAQKHLFIITIDGVRWEEIYKGADPALIFNEEYVKDTSLTRQLYWDSTETLRRRRLMPFFWSTIVNKG
jgi:hypothetical protein